MHTRLRTGFFLLIVFFLIGCSPRTSPTTSELPAIPTNLSIPAGLTLEQFTTLSSLQKVDNYPLYTMTYQGAYRPRETARLLDNSPTAPIWACSLFTVLVDEDNLLYGRNFDWQFSPALLLFTDPPDGYASVSMVDIEYLGFDETNANNIDDMSITKQASLLDAPYLPFDGMNEHGLAIGMAAVPTSNIQLDVNKETVGSLGIIRQILDHARTVDEAVEIMQRYNIDFTGGPPLHYLMADVTSKSVLVEYYNGEMHILANEKPWHVATNFLRSAVTDPNDSRYWRYSEMTARLAETNGQIDSKAAMQLLGDVAQNNTQWSVIYQMSTGTISVAMGRQYETVHQFQLELVSR